MGARLRGLLHDFEIRRPHEVRAEDPPAREFDEASARSFLRPFTRDPFAMASLRGFAAGSLPDGGVGSMSDDRIVERLAALLAQGRLRVVPLPRFESLARAFGTRGPEPVDEPVDDPAGTPASAPPPSAPASSEKPSSQQWISLQLLDDDTGAPIAGVELRLRLPDGSVGTFATNGQGVVRLDDFPEGTIDLEDVADTEGFEVVRFE